MTQRVDTSLRSPSPRPRTGSSEYRTAIYTQSTLLCWPLCRRLRYGSANVEIVLPRPASITDYRLFRCHRFHCHRLSALSTAADRRGIQHSDRTTFIRYMLQPSSCNPQPCEGSGYFTGFAARLIRLRLTQGYNPSWNRQPHARPRPSSLLAPPSRTETQTGYFTGFAARLIRLRLTQGYNPSWNRQPHARRPSHLRPDRDANSLRNRRNEPNEPSLTSTSLPHFSS